MPRQTWPAFAHTVQWCERRRQLVGRRQVAAAGARVASPVSLASGMSAMKIAVRATLVQSGKYRHRNGEWHSSGEVASCFQTDGSSSGTTISGTWHRYPPGRTLPARTDADAMSNPVAKWRRLSDRILGGRKTCLFVAAE